MAKRIPITDARSVCEKHNAQQAMIVAWDGKMVLITTYGKTMKDCREVAELSEQFAIFLGMK